MKVSHKGQASAEYLVLLSMALVLMLILVAILGGFEGSLGSINESESSLYWGDVARPFAITSWGQSGSTLYISVANMGVERLFLRKINIDNVNKANQMSVNNVVADLSPGWAWRAASSKVVSIPGLQECKVNGYDSYAYNISFVYDTININDLKQTGERQLIGYCS